MNEILLTLVIGITGGLLGAFYRNCLIPDNMIFNFLYDILSGWVESSRFGATKWDKLLGFIAYPLGYCIYCSTTWITIILFFILIGISIWIFLALGIQHLIVVMYCKYLIKDNNDLKRTEL